MTTGQRIGRAGGVAAIDAAIAALGELPVLDRTVTRVRALSEDPSATTLELVAALEQDANLSTNVLRLANLGLSSRPVRASSLHQAVTLIGRRAVGRFALEASVYGFFEQGRGGTGTTRGQLHVHAVEVASCASGLAARAGGDAGAAHLAGLLHDIGKLVLPLAFGEDVVEQALGGHASGPDRVAAELAAFGIDHAEAAARLAEQSGLPGDVVDAIGRHHGGQRSDGPGATVVASVAAANAAVDLMHGHRADTLLLHAALETLGVSTQALEDIACAAMPAATSAGAEETLSSHVARLEREAREDELTGLLNRRYWGRTAREELAVAPGTVLLCDIDHFKRINDFHGHTTGDFVLSEVGRILRRHGIAGRLGGDEFALVVPAADDGLRIAEAILAEVRALFGDPLLPVSLSIGVAESQTAGADPGELLRLADAALYEAKAAGRGAARRSLAG